MHYPQFKIISDIDKLFGEKHNDYIKHIIDISTKDIIYQKQKNGEQMCLSDVKRSVLKDLNIMRSQELMQNNKSTFDEKRKFFIDGLRTDPATKHSW